MGLCLKPSCEGANPICCIDPRSGALFGQSMALDGLHEMRKAGAPGMRPCPEHQGGLQRLGQKVHKGYEGKQFRFKNVANVRGKEISFKNFAKSNGQVTQSNPPACRPKELQRTLLCFGSGALQCWRPQSAYCAPE